MERTDGVDDTEAFAHEFLIVVHVSSHDFEHIVEIARYVVAFGYLLDIPNGFDKVEHAILGVLLEPDVAEDGDVVERVLVEDGDVLLDESVLMQVLDAFVDGGGREVNARGKFLGGEGGVVLQNAK